MGSPNYCIWKKQMYWALEKIRRDFLMWWEYDPVIFILGRQVTHHSDLCDPALWVMQDWVSLLSEMLAKSQSSKNLLTKS